MQGSNAQSVSVRQQPFIVVQSSWVRLRNLDFKFSIVVTVSVHVCLSVVYVGCDLLTTSPGSAIHPKSSWIASSLYDPSKDKMLEMKETKENGSIPTVF